MIKLYNWRNGFLKGDEKKGGKKEEKINKSLVPHVLFLASNLSTGRKFFFKNEEKIGYEVYHCTVHTHTLRR